MKALKGLTRHHRRAKVYGGKGNRKNISYVPQDQHRAFHLLFSTCPPPCIAQILNLVWIDPRWELIARKKGGHQ